MGDNGYEMEYKTMKWHLRSKLIASPLAVMFENKNEVAEEKKAMMT